MEFLRGDDADLVHTGRITPVHPASEGITTRTIRELVHRALERLPTLHDPMAGALTRAGSIVAYDRAVRDIHFPEDDRALARARERLKFDELFTLELGVAFRKHRVEAEQQGSRTSRTTRSPAGCWRRSRSSPPAPSSRAMAEVGEAMARPRPMNVLLQGDVGAGKTLVALHAALVAIESGHQAAIMAPTEVLAGQHLRSVAALLDGVGGIAYLDCWPRARRRRRGPGVAARQPRRPDPVPDAVEPCR